MRSIPIILLCMFFACTDRTKRNKELWMMIKSQNIGSIIAATEKIRKARDTSMISAVLYHADDPRITHEAFYKGKSVYQIKMETLREITRLAPPAKITYEVDTSIIQFYSKKFLKY